MTNSTIVTNIINSLTVDFFNLNIDLDIANKLAVEYYNRANQTKVTVEQYAKAAILSFTNEAELTFA